MRCLHFVSFLVVLNYKKRFPDLCTVPKVITNQGEENKLLSTEWQTKWFVAISQEGLTEIILENDCVSGIHFHSGSYMQFRKKALPVSVHLSEPQFDYCRVVWDGLSGQLSEKLQKLQHCAARVITKSSYDTNSCYLLNSLSWDNISVRREKHKVNLM